MSLALKLAEAEAAYHALMTGQAAVSFTDQNGERVEYRGADAPRLAAYIQALAGAVAGQARTHTVRFSTSKGL